MHIGSVCGISQKDEELSQQGEYGIWISLVNFSITHTHTHEKG